MKTSSAMSCLFMIAMSILLGLDYGKAIAESPNNSKSSQRLEVLHAKLEVAKLRVLARRQELKIANLQHQPSVTTLQTLRKEIVDADAKLAHASNQRQKAETLAEKRLVSQEELFAAVQKENSATKLASNLKASLQARSENQGLRTEEVVLLELRLKIAEARVVLLNTLISRAQQIETEG